MPYDSAGIFSLSPGYLAIAGQTIQPSQHNPPLEDLALQGLSNVLVRDGRAAMVGNLKMGTNKITGMADATSATDAVTKQQLDHITQTVSQKAANYTAVKDDYASFIQFTAAATLALTEAATLGANWWCEVQATNGNVIIDPNASETIDGNLTAVVRTGQVARIFCTGSAFITVVLEDANSATPDFLKGLITSKSSAFVISVGAGEIKGNGKLVINAAPFTKNLNAVWAAGSGNGGRLEAAALTANTTYHLHALVRDSDGSFDWGFSTSATAPTIPAGYSWVGRFDWCYTNAGLTAIFDYTQTGNKKLLIQSTWYASVGNIADAVVTLPATIPIPSGIRTKVSVSIDVVAAGSSSAVVYINDGDTAAAQTSSGVFAFITAGGSASELGVSGSVITTLARQLRNRVVIITSGNATVAVSDVEDYTLNRIY